MTDEHQVNSIIAAAICDTARDQFDQMNPELAKQFAKCILEALKDGGLHIVPISTAS